MAGLVLTFRLGQRAFLMTSDGEIEVELVRYGDDAIRLRFVAPKHVKIEREKFRAKKNAQQEESARIDCGSVIATCVTRESGGTECR
jgi:sRNA-binding carbon storage regulator CsrA